MSSAAAGLTPDPAFRVDSPEVRAAADAGWWACTPIGIAVLRYQECLALLRDWRLRHGSLDGLAASGVTSGLFADWMRAMLLNVEGHAHQRQRRLVSKAFTQRSVDVLRPFMRAKAHELIDSFAGLAMTIFTQHPEQWRLLAQRSTTAWARGWPASRCARHCRSCRPGSVTSSWTDPWSRDPTSASPARSPCPCDSPQPR